MDKIASFDLETDPFKRDRVPVPFASDFFENNTHHTKWGADCVQYLLERLLKFKGIAYAHNGGKFDFYYLLPFLPRKRIKRFLTIGGRIVQISFQGGLDLRDSYALIPRPLREWAKDGIDYRNLESDVREKHRAEIVSYLRKDTEYLHEMVTAFNDEYGSHLTLASAAFKILHKEFGVKVCHISESMDARFRKYYFAGRVEYYALGDLGGGFSCVDVNSSFPWSMTRQHWEGEEYITSSDLPKRNLEQSFLRGIAVSTGAFPFRMEDGSVSFPADGKEREFFITGWEWKAALDLGLLVRWRFISAHIPINTRDYKEYITHFYRIKSQAESAGNKGERLFSKLLMNSGYGKFGMDIREFEEFKLCDWREPPDDSPEWLIDRDDPKIGLTIYKRPASAARNKFNNVCVAASITGCSRALLLRAKQICRDVVYCDTDSLIARDVSALDIGPKLGQWKLEQVFDSLHIAGKKLYAGRDKETGKWKTASKGVKLTAEEIIAVAAGQKVEYQFEAPSFSFKGKVWARFTKRTIQKSKPKAA